MNCVATIAHGEIGEALYGISGPLMERYATRCGAAGPYALTEDELGPDWAMTDQLGIGDFLRHHGRVLYLDADCLVRADCPNLFDLAPETHFAAHDECATFNAGALAACHEYMADTALAEGLPVPNTRGRYFNFGVLLFGRHAAGLFAPPRRADPHPWHAQAILNVRLFNSGMPIYHLPQCFNCSPGLTNDRRYWKSNYIVHVAGMGDTEARRAARLDKMREIVGLWKREGLV